MTDKDAQINRAVAFKGAVEIAAARVAATAGNAARTADPETIAGVIGELTEVLLPVVEGSQTPQEAAGASDSRANGEVTPVELGDAYRAYMSTARNDDEKKQARTLVDLQLSALGAASSSELDADGRAKMLQFFKENTE